jgi:hypothetical protein
MQYLSNLILNRQWSLAIGAVATAIAFALTEYAEDIPVELVPVLAALVTWLRVWSKASVEQAVADATETDTIIEGE